MSKHKKQEIEQVFGNKLRLRVSGICIKEDQILLIKHSYLGKKDYLWAPPGGGVQFGEDIKTSLKREFVEETALIVEIQDFLFVNEFLDFPLHAVELFFTVQIISGQPKLGKDPEMNTNSQILEEIAFKSLEELKEENPLHLHSCLREISNLQELFSKSVYHFSED